MQAKRKLTALLLSLCMLLGMLPMTAFAAGVPAAPTNLKLELTETGLKASWDKPETTGGLDIFEYEVTLYGHFDGTAGEKTKVETRRFSGRPPAPLQTQEMQKALSILPTR